MSQTATEVIREFLTVRHTEARIGRSGAAGAQPREEPNAGVPFDEAMAQVIDETGPAALGTRTANRPDRVSPNTDPQAESGDAQSDALVEALTGLANEVDAGGVELPEKIDPANAAQIARIVSEILCRRPDGPGPHGQAGGPQQPGEIATVPQAAENGERPRRGVPNPDALGLGVPAGGQDEPHTDAMMPALMVVATAGGDIQSIDVQAVAEPPTAQPLLPQPMQSTVQLDELVGALQQTTAPGGPDLPPPAMAADTPVIEGGAQLVNDPLDSQFAVFDSSPTRPAAERTPDEPPAADLPHANKNAQPADGSQGHSAPRAPSDRPAPAGDRAASAPSPHGDAGPIKVEVASTPPPPEPGLRVSAEDTNSPTSTRRGTPSLSVPPQSMEAPAEATDPSPSQDSALPAEPLAGLGDAPPAEVRPGGPPTPDVPGAELFDASATADRIARAMSGQLRGRNVGTIRLRLEPPGLGDLRVQISLGNDRIRITLLPSGESAAQLLTSQLHLLRDAIQSHGLSVTQLNVESPRAEQAPLSQGDGQTRENPGGNGTDQEDGRGGRSPGRQSADGFAELNREEPSNASGPAAAPAGDVSRAGRPSRTVDMVG